MLSLPEVLCPATVLRTGCNYPKGPGDRVAIGNNRGPLYEVVHIAGSTAWVRPLANGAEGLVQLENLRLVDQPAAAPLH